MFLNRFEKANYLEISKQLLAETRCWVLRHTSLSEQLEKEMSPLYWVGLALIITAVLVMLSTVLACMLHCNDDTGTSGGFDGIEIFCLLPCSISFIIGGIFCMVSTATWCLIIIIIFNMLSGFVHLWVTYKCTGCQTPKENASDSIVHGKQTAWTRVIPELLGIILSFAAAGLAINELA